MLCVILINSKDILNLLSTSDNIDNVKTHPGVMKIKDVINIEKTFNFDFIDIKNMTKKLFIA